MYRSAHSASSSDINTYSPKEPEIFPHPHGLYLKIDVVIHSRPSHPHIHILRLGRPR